MLKKKLSIIFIIFLSIFSLYLFTPKEKELNIIEIKSPTKFELEGGDFELIGLETFDSYFSSRNLELAKEFGLSEVEAFIMGNLAKNWASNLMEGRKVVIKDKEDLLFYKFSYRTKFLFSGFCFVDSKPYYKEAFEKKVREVRRVKYKVLDLDSYEVYNPDDKEVRKLKNYILLRKSHLPKEMKEKRVRTKLENGNLKVYLTDFTSKLVPDNKCSTDICREVLSSINNAKISIDIAIYGYSSVPEIEKALLNALNRNVKVRLVYDKDDKGENIYPDTEKLLSIISNNMSDYNSKNARNIMHNKFYIFDDETLITGSANLSHTDMSGFNTNSIVVIKSKELSSIYKKEFEQMFSGKFHLDKNVQTQSKITISGSDVETYFSPQDKSLTNAVLPLIKNAKSYIYIPTFVLTEERVVEELIKAKNKGVDVRIIIDALNASIRHSKHRELRAGGIAVKTENYAGKMHSKSMIVDDEYTIIGSMNFSDSGENKNDENLLVIKNSQLAKFYKEFFLYQWEKIDNRWLKQNVRAEGKDSIGSCFDGIDNNYDGLVDSEDPACR